MRRGMPAVLCRQQRLGMFECREIVMSNDYYFYCLALLARLLPSIRRYGNCLVFLVRLLGIAFEYINLGCRLFFATSSCIALFL